MAKAAKARTSNASGRYGRKTTTRLPGHFRSIRRWLSKARQEGFIDIGCSRTIGQLMSKDVRTLLPLWSAWLRVSAATRVQKISLECCAYRDFCIVRLRRPTWFISWRRPDAVTAGSKLSPHSLLSCGNSTAQHRPGRPRNLARVRHGTQGRDARGWPAAVG